MPDQQILRHQVADFITARATLFEAFLLEGDTIDSFTNAIRRGKEAEHIAMQVTSEILNANIRIVHPGDDHSTTIMPSSATAPSTIYLGNTPKGESGHYYSLVGKSAPSPIQAKGTSVPHESFSDLDVSLTSSPEKPTDLPAGNALLDLCMRLPTAFNLIALNVQGLTTNRHGDWKVEELRECLRDSKVSVLVLSETWLKDEPPNIDGYRVVSRNRQIKSRGGLTAYISTKLNVEEEINLREMDIGTIETLWLKMRYLSPNLF